MPHTNCSCYNNDTDYTVGNRIHTSIAGITAPQPSLFNTLHNTVRGTGSYAVVESTNTTNNISFFFLAMPINKRSDTMCSIQPLPFWLPVCSLYGTNQEFNRDLNTKIEKFNQTIDNIFSTVIHRASLVTSLEYS